MWTEDVLLSRATNTSVGSVGGSGAAGTWLDYSVRVTDIVFLVLMLVQKIIVVCKYFNYY